MTSWLSGPYPCPTRSLAEKLMPSRSVTLSRPSPSAVTARMAKSATTSLLKGDRSNASTNASPMEGPPATVWGKVRPIPASSLSVGTSSGPTISYAGAGSSRSHFLPKYELTLPEALNSRAHWGISGR
jgi:hypothetical protein